MDKWMRSRKPPEPPPPAQERGSSAFIRKALIVAAMAALLIALYKLATVFLLIAAATVVAALIHLIADPLHKRFGVPPKGAALISIVIILTLVGAAIWMFGREVGQQINTFSEEFPRSLSAVREWLNSTEVGRIVGSSWSAESVPAGDVFASIRKWIGGVATAGVYALVAIVAGIIFALTPKRHRDGFLLLFPRGRRERYREAMNQSGVRLKGWLVGQFISMLIIGVLTSIGLLILGIPSWLFLGIFAGLAQFVPMVGPLVSSIPGLSIAASIGLSELAWTAAIYIFVQQLESNLITPFVMRKTTSLPMVATLFSIIAFGILFGPLGVVLATPIAVVAYVLLRMLYVEDVIGEAAAAGGSRSA